MAEQPSRGRLVSGNYRCEECGGEFPYQQLLGDDRMICERCLDEIIEDGAATEPPKGE